MRQLNEYISHVPYHSTRLGPHISPNVSDVPQLTRLEVATQLPSFYAEDTPMAANETWARLHADPMFAMKQQEIAAKKAVMKNPVMMASVKLKVRNRYTQGGNAFKCTPVLHGCSINLCTAEGSIIG